jgi:hypothetical protein
MRKTAVKQNYSKCCLKSNKTTWKIGRERLVDIGTLTGVETAMVNITETVNTVDIIAVPITNIKVKTMMTTSLEINM